MDTRRFHRPEYKRQIREVRHYRRNVRQHSENKIDSLLSKIGLEKILYRVLAIVVLCGALYLIYFAKFLRITNIQVAGADQAQVSEINADLNAYGKTFNFIFPQNNILFFSSGKFKAYLLSKDVSVYSVQSIKRRLWHSVQIEVKQKVPAYVLQSNGNYYILNSDGSVGVQLQSSDNQINKYPRIMDTSAESVNPGQKFFTDAQFSFLGFLNDNISKYLQSPVDHYEISGASSNELIVYIKAGLRVYFDDTTDPNAYMQRLMSLWGNLSPEQQKKLAYFDLRFDPNAYGCFKGDPCDTQTLPQLPSNPANAANSAAASQPATQPQTVHPTNSINKP